MMIRNLKVLAISLVAMLALGVSGASGAEFTAAKYPVEIEGEQIVNASFPNGHEFVLNGSAFTCSELIFDAVGSYSGPTTDITFTPTYKLCTAHTPLGTLPVTVTHNGCNFTYTVHQGSGNTIPGTAHLVCPVGVPGIEIHLYSSHNNHTNKASLCTYNVHPQTIEQGITYHNDHPDVRISTNSNFVLTRISGSALVCGAVVQNAFSAGEMTVIGTNAGGEVTIDVG